MTGIEGNGAPERVGGAEPLAVAHVAGAYQAYPGETVTFYTRVDAAAGVPGFTLRVALPVGVSVADYRGPDAQALPRITLHAGAHNVIWRVERGGTAGDSPREPACYEYQVMATVAPVLEEGFIESRALVTAEVEGETSLQVAETVSVAVLAQGRYLNYLPAIYRDDDLMGRFLMLFESFWAPVSAQIDSLAYYFDPAMTPPEFLPWLASWIDLVLDERWPIDKRRRLLASAAALYRKRGTRQGLEEYLEIYTGTRPRIVEHRAHNFRLGQGARLGPGIALGRGNEPHTFTVTLRLPAVPAAEGDDDSPGDDQARRRRIEAIVEAEKPAHAGYQLRIETEGELGE